MSTLVSQSLDVGLAPGTIVGNKYRIDGLLGAGGMGVVLSATHLELDAPVAIKVVREDLAENEAVVASLLFEARVAARMRGSHIVRVLDVARLETGAPYIVMERLQGSDLATVLAERRTLSVTDAVSYLLQACEGLGEAHQLGLIHRDLKPENLFLATTPEGVVLKILDFGISKDIGRSIQAGNRPTLTKAGSPVGSPYYMSPEQMCASPKLDARADIWSLGAILFEFVTGRCPFQAGTPSLLCSKVMIEPAPSLLTYASTAPAQLDAIVQRCLQKEPTDRFQTVTELALALRDFLHEEQIAAARALRSTTGGDPNTDALAPTVLAWQPFDGQWSPRPARRNVRLAVLSSSVILAASGAFFWHVQGLRSPSVESGQARSASILVTPSEALPPAPPTTPRTPPKTRLVVLAPVVPVPPAIVPPAAVSADVASSAAPPPRDLPAPSWKRAEPAPAPDPDSLATRYGL
jgi:serine/threonine protein kinase